MDFTQFPGQWEWVALILGGVSFLMAVSPFIQMIWGKPKLTLKFHRRTGNIGYISLECYVYNLPIRNKLLTWLGVRRENTSGIIALFELREALSGEVVRDFHVTEIRTPAGEVSDSTSTPASLLGLGISLVLFDKAAGQAKVGMPHELRELPQGTYEAHLIICEGDRFHRATRRLIVTNTEPYVYWEVSSS